MSMESHTPMKQTLFCYGIIETFTQDLGGHTHSLLGSRVALDLNAVAPGIPHVVLATQLNNVCHCLSPYPHPLLLPELQQCVWLIQVSGLSLFINEIRS